MREPLVLHADVLRGCSVLIRAGTQRLLHTSNLRLPCHPLCSAVLTVPAPRASKLVVLARVGEGLEVFPGLRGLVVVLATPPQPMASGRASLCPRSRLAFCSVSWSLPSQLQLTGDILLSHTNWFPPYHSMEVDGEAGTEPFLWWGPGSPRRPVLSRVVVVV